ncbi:MAG: polyphosphate polymerase domain-containing protein [Desulfobacteraceae bacterium]|jgi:hypothetical protein
MVNRLADFHPTTLDDMDGIKLLKRYDTKFTFHKDQLADVFSHLTQNYKILEIGNHRSFTYENIYYDTDDYLFYNQHHNKKLNRYKIRCRRYQQSNQRFFEVKFKNNRRKTIKSRLPLANGEIHPGLCEESKIFAKEHMTNGDRRIVDQLRPKLQVEYNRITLTNQAKKERLTIDIGLTYIDKNSKRCRIDNLVIAELKSEKVSMNSKLYQFLKGLNIFPTRFSKYCMGVAMTEQRIKSNRFKKNLLRLKRFC